MKQELLQRLIQALTEMDGAAASKLVGIAEALAEQFPERVIAPALAMVRGMPAPETPRAPAMGAHNLMAGSRQAQSQRPN